VQVAMRSELQTLPMKAALTGGESFATRIGVLLKTAPALEPWA